MESQAEFAPHSVTVISHYWLNNEVTEPHFYNGADLKLFF